VYVTDIQSDSLWENYREQMSRYGIRAVWLRPLFSGEGKVLGTFAILHREVRGPAAADLQVIESASHIAGIAIERHMNEQKLRHERDRLSLLLEITNSMTSNLDLGHLLEALSANLLSVTRCDFCALLLPHGDGNQLPMTVLYNPEGRGAIRDGTTVPIKGTACGKAFLSGKNQRIDRLEDLRDDPETFGNGEGRRFLDRVLAEGLTSGCELPLIGRKGVIGVLVAFSRSERAFSEDEFAFLEQVSLQVAHRGGECFGLQ
jgi:formate hydrogenlyase transcriptional activator